MSLPDWSCNLTANRIVSQPEFRLRQIFGRFGFSVMILRNANLHAELRVARWERLNSNPIESGARLQKDMQQDPPAHTSKIKPSDQLGN